MNKLFILIYYLIILGSNILAYFIQFDLSIVWLAGVIILLYMYLIPDMFAKKRLKKNQEPVKAMMNGKTTLILIIPILINCLLIFCFY